MGLEHQFWEEQPPPYYNEPYPSQYAYPNLGYGGFHYDYTPPPPYTYDPYPQHNPQSPYFQTPYQYHHPPPYTPPQDAYQHELPSTYTTFFPTNEPFLSHQCETFPPLTQDHQDLQVLLQEQEGSQRTQRRIMATIDEAVNRLILLRSSDQGIPLEECEGSTKACSEEKSVEPQGEEEGLELEVQQEKDSEVCEPEERRGELREVDQYEDSIINDFLSSLINPLDYPNEHLPIELEKDMEVDFSQPPCCDVSDGEEEEEVGKEGVDNQKHIEWVAISPISFIGPHQYAILESGYQLKVPLGLVHGGGRSSGC
ncbi:uncharacterized protein LOC107490110 [Arachis duranensis]|uniref:Uncharacterized protein LOC107490110 n=1 Tax=Arachis duranensis TaxID=130453 RepID=A0A6P4DFR1_ARADU|nr:uncharacterized protein LOC107490110 [Arachis duranensis]